MDDVCAQCGLNSDDVDLHLGFDGGQGSLKLVLSITERNFEASAGRSTYAQVYF